MARDSTSKNRLGTRWALGLILGLAAFGSLLALPVPHGLRVAASRTLMPRLPEEVSRRLQQQVGAPESTLFEEKYGRFEQLSSAESVAVSKIGRRMLTAEAYRHLGKRSQQDYQAPATVALLADRLARAAWRVLAVAVLMLIFWVFGVFPVPVTALLPLVLFPLLQVAHLRHPAFPGAFGVGEMYGHHLIFLFMGTFMLSKAMIRWGLDRRIALQILGIFGARPSLLMLGFILAAAFLSMWISNTATAAMMVPIALGVLEQVQHPEASRYRVGVLLSVAYGATVGGIGTLVGSPPNGIYASFVGTLTGTAVGFSDWLRLGMPFVLVFLPVLWIVMAKRFVPAGLTLPRRAVFAEPGPITGGEKRVGVIFLLMVILWVTRSELSFLGWPGWSSLTLCGAALSWVNDSVVALLGVLLLFGVPVDLRAGEFVLDLRSGLEISWGTLILFGGGLALGQGIANTGLGTWFASGLNVVAAGGTHVVLLAVAIFASLITEVTSNTATATMLMPLLYALGRSVGGMERTFMSTGAVATSLAFMLPIATPPNAVVYGSGAVTMGQMAKTGVVLNFLAVLCWWIVASVTLL